MTPRDYFRRRVLSAVHARLTAAELFALARGGDGEAFVALYRATAAPADDAPATRPPALPKRLQKPTRGPASLIRAYLEERGLAKVLAVGEDAERLAITLPLAGLLGGVRTPPVTPIEILAWARPRFEARTTDDPDALAPLYLQPSTPEKVLEAKREAAKAAADEAAGAAGAGP
jgi:hypothetical protein